MSTYEAWKEVFTEFDSVALKLEELIDPKVSNELFETLSERLDEELEARGMTSGRNADEARKLMSSPTGQVVKSALDVVVKSTSEKIPDVKKLCSTWEESLKELLTKEVWEEHPMKLPGMDWEEDLRVLEADIAYWNSEVKRGGLSCLSVCEGALEWKCGTQQWQEVIAKWKGNTALHYAAWTNADDVAAMLLEDGTDVNAKNWAGDTPLHVAVLCNATETTAVLLQRGARLNTRNRNDVPEMESLRSRIRGVRVTAQILAPSPPELNVHNGSTPLHLAATKNAHEIADALTQHGANLNALDETERTPLHVAAASNAHAVTGMLLDHGANINAKDEDGYTPLHYAVAHNALSSVGMLLEREADVKAMNYDGETPLHLYAKYPNPEHRIVGMLLHYGAEVNAKAYYGYTPLVNAARYLLRHKVKTLLDAGADTGDILMTLMQGSFGNMGWNEPNRQKTLEIIRNLLESGANVNTEVSTWLRDNLGWRIRDSGTIEYEIAKFL